MKILVFTIVFFGMLSLFFLIMEMTAFFKRLQHKKKIDQTFELNIRDTLKKTNTVMQNPKEKISLYQTLGYLLITADIPLSPLKYIFINLGIGLLIFLPAWVFAGNFTIAVILFLVWLILPVIYLVLKKLRIQKLLIRQMPEALGMVVRAIKVGQSVDSALKDAADSMAVPFSTEIRIIYEEIRMGLSFDLALKNFENRYPGLADVKIFCTSFIIQRETGGSLAPILEGLADTIKKRFHFQRQIKTFSAEARTSAIVIGLLPLLFVIITYLFNPEYITRLTDNPLGKMIIAAAFILEFAGFIVMRKMARIEI